MKLFQLAALRIWHYFQSNKLLFLLYIVGTATCSLIFVYFYGHGNASNREDPYYTDRTFEIAFTQEISEADMKAKIAEVLPKAIDDYFMRKQIPLNEVVFDGETLMDKMDPSIYVSIYAGEMGSNLEIGCCQNGSLNFYSAMGRTQFREGDGPWVAFLGTDFARVASIHVDETLTIAGQNVKVIGITGSFLANLYLPYEGFEKLGRDITFCEIMLQQSVTLEESAQIQQALQTAFPGADIRGPDGYLKFRENYIKNDKLMSVLLYLVGLVSFLFLIQYMLSRSSQEVVVFGLVGAKKRSLLLILVIENLLLTLLSAGLGMAVYFSLQKSVFLPFAVAPDFVYAAWDIVQILSAVLALSLLAALPFYVRYCSRTLAQMKTRYIL